MKGLMKGWQATSKANPTPSDSVSKSSKLMQSLSLNDRHVLDNKKILLGQLVGEGAFAKVYQCVLDGREAVAKVRASAPPGPPPPGGGRGRFFQKKNRGSD